MAFGKLKESWIVEKTFKQNEIQVEKIKWRTITDEKKADEKIYRGNKVFVFFCVGIAILSIFQLNDFDNYSWFKTKSGWVRINEKAWEKRMQKTQWL